MINKIENITVDTISIYADYVTKSQSSSNKEIRVSAENIINRFMETVTQNTEEVRKSRLEMRQKYPKLFS